MYNKWYMYICIFIFKSKGNVGWSILLLFSHLRFCSSSLWLRQSLSPDMFPKSLNERDFVVPGPGSGDSLLCNESRRNLTDQQETSQWVGGIMVPKQLLTALFSHLMLPTAIKNCFFKSAANKPSLVLYNVNLILSGGVKSHGAFVIHPTSYDGCVELAAMQLGYWVSGSSVVEPHWKCSKEIIKSHLVQACFSVIVLKPSLWIE